MNAFIVLLQQQPPAFQIFAWLVAGMVCSLFAGGVLLVAELLCGDRA